MDAILSDVRAVDVSRTMAGAIAGMLLAEAGADVSWIGTKSYASSTDEPIFAFAHRSKRRLNDDLSTAEGQAKLHACLAEADIVIHDYTPSEAVTLGLDEAALRARYPQLIPVAVTAFPAGHPDQDLPAVDSLVLASMGVLDEQQPVRRDGPMFLRFPLGSWGAAWLAAIGAITRLIVRDRKMGTGPVSTSLAQGALLPLAMHWYRAERPSPSLANGLPKRADVSLFQCADGVWLHIMTNADHVPMVQEAIAALPEQYRKPVSDGSAFRTLFPLFDAYRQVFPTRPSSEWLEALRAADIAVQPVFDIGQLFDDEQVQANDLMATVEDDRWGRTRQPAVPISISPPFTIGAPQSAESPRKPAPPSSSPFARYPLEGLKVLDFGTHLAGPLAPMLAADLGADVIKVESISGDQMRWVEWCFISCQRGKRSIALQLKDPRARKVLERLVGWADVVHHNMRMPAARKLGLDYETLRAINPALIYTHVSAYGAQGPRKDWPGFDQLFQASGGWESLCAGESNPPIWLRFGMIDHQVALASLYGTLLALRHRDRTGEGQFVSSSLLGAALFTCGETVQLADGKCTPVARLDPMQMGTSDRHRLFQCADGWVLMMADEDIFRHVLEAAKVANVEALEHLLLQEKVSSALTMLGNAGATVVEARLGQRDAFFDSPVNRDVGLTTELDHPDYGRLELAGRYLDFGDLENRIERAPSTLGQHSREILADMGMDDDEIAMLFREGVVA
jgi:crotonobetainyl-CoA:carnitine CoA-transferase CaiB-like acyl-CoA transferase